MIRRVLCIFTVLAIFPASQVIKAAGFPQGQLLVSYNETGGTNAVCTVDPLTGAVSTVWTTSGNGQNLGDVVYDSITTSAYVVLNPSSTASSIIKLDGSPQHGYTATTYLTGLNKVHALTTDPAGNLYFDQQDPQSMYQQIWKADPHGQLQSVTISPTPFGYLFEPVHMTVSPDSSSLYISTAPDNRIDVVSLSDGAFSTIGAGNIGFPSGLAFNSVGSLLVTRHFTANAGALDDIATVSLQTGAATSYLDDSSWMPFQPNGIWEDMACDSANGDIFAEKGRLLYAINDNLQSSLVHQFGIVDTPVGLDVIPVPEPSTFILLSVGPISLLGMGWRRRSRRPLQQ